MKNIFLFSIILTLLSCEEVPIQIPEAGIIETGKTVLVEELTGVSCPNCPAGAAQLASLIELYQGSVIGVSIHGDFLCDPLSSSKYDFRSETGVELENYLKSWFGKPCAAFNRAQQDSETEFAISKFDLWGSYVDNELSKEQQVEILIDRSYDPNTRILDLAIAVSPLVNLEGDFRIGVMIAESHIIDAQLDQTDVIEEYEHNHVLRTMLTPIEGTTLSQTLVENETINKSFQFTIPEDDNLWVAENMEAIVFVNKITPESKEILQAAEVHVVE